VEMPNGSYLEWPEGVSAEEFKMKANRISPAGATSGYEPYKPPVPQLKTILSPNQIDVAAESQPVKEPSDILQNLGAGATRLTLQPLAHPLRTIAGFGQLARAPFDPGAEQDVAEGMIKPFVGKPGGEAIANIPMLALGKAAGAGEGVGDLIARDPLAQYRSPLIPLEEAQARALTDKLGVQPAAYPQTMRTIQSNLGNLKQVGDYAVGGRYRTPLEFGKVAQSAGQPASDLFKSHLIEPNAEAMTPKGSIGDIYGRISEINRLLDPAYRQGREAQTMTMLEREQMAKLKAEKDDLTNTLYSELSARSGMPVDEIRRINMQGAGLRDVGSEADAAQISRGLGYASPGVPFSKTQAIGRFINGIRGGPERVAGRKISRIMGTVEQEPTPLPNPEQIGGYRKMAEQEDLGHLRETIAGQQANREASIARKPAGLGPTPKLEPIVETPPPNYAQDFVNRLRTRAGENRAAQVPAPQRPTPESPLNRYLGRARETQEQAKTLRKR